MLALIPGAWYLVYSCKSCHSPQILFPDLTRGKAKLLATYLVVCPACGYKAAYEGGEIEHYHHPLQAKPAVPQNGWVRINGQSPGRPHHV